MARASKGDTGTRRDDRTHGSLVALLVVWSALALVPRPGSAADPCTRCAEWNATQHPLRLYGNTYYVGVRGLSSILITSAQGDVLIDGDLPESAPRIAANIRALGFRVGDVKLILNSHDHFDHAGGIAELQRLTGARVAASAPSARVLEQGRSQPDDPQFRTARAFAPVAGVQIIHDGETIRLGELAVTAHLTPGHTPGGTSWSWSSCEGQRCLRIVYADSLTPVSSEGFRFTRNDTYPHVLEDFERSFRTLEALPCDILLTPHPEASDLWERVRRRDAGDADALVDGGACRAYVARSRAALARRLDAERRRGH